MKVILKKHWILIAVLAISAMAHGWNMMRFPYFENDEGIYLAQAWSLIKQGTLSPYTYWYDHAPAGWILVAGWLKLTGGLFTFGPSAASGRVMMLLVHIAVTAMMYFVAWRVTKSRGIGVMAILIFALSPLAIYYQRRLLLDNLAVFWVFATLTLIYARAKLTVWQAIGAGIVFGVAVLTKEVAVFFTPGIVYAIWSRRKHHRVFTIIPSVMFMGLVVGLYPLLAFLKTELWPVGFMGDTRDRVSLIGSLREQAGRGVNYPFYNPNSLFYGSLTTWMNRDSVLVVLMGIGPVAAGILAIFVPRFRLFAVLGWGFMAFLLTNKLVIDFYVVPLIPIAALCVGSVLSTIVKQDKVWMWTAIIMAEVFLMRPIGQYTRDETKAQIQTIEYVKKNLLTNANIVTDSSILLDLWEARSEGDPKFKNANWAWKVEKDKEVYETVLKNDWRNIEYVLVSHEILRQIRQTDTKYLQLAVANANLMAEWSEGSTSYINMEKTISTNGDWMGVMKVRSKTDIVLRTAWDYYKKNFLHSYGQIIDPQTGNTTSEGQAYAMLRAVWSDDQLVFDGVWQWTRDHLQHRENDKLLSWLWKDDKLADAASATDGDIDIATALVLAAKRWDMPEYREQAVQIILDIWKWEVGDINGKYYLLSGSDMRRDGGYLVNPSYFSPAAYRLFAEVDTESPWLMLAEDNYWFLNQLANRTGLIPNWIWVEGIYGQIGSAATLMGSEADNYGYDAFRTYFRVALDWKWNLNEQAKQFLEAARPNLVIFSAQNLVMQVGTLAALDNTIEGKKVYQKYFDASKTADFSGWWEDKNNYYTQNWAWLGTALYGGFLKKEF